MARSRGTRTSMRRSAPKVARVRGHGGGIRGRNGRSAFGHSGTTTPYGKGTPSVKRRDVYDSLRRKGYTKEKAARISNAVANGTNGHGARGRAGGKRSGPHQK